MSLAFTHGYLATEFDQRVDRVVRAFTGGRAEVETVEYDYARDAFVAHVLLDRGTRRVPVEITGWDPVRSLVHDDKFIGKLVALL